MNHIVIDDIRRVDLNLLVVLLALYHEQSVTKAAERLYLGQPAVSGALKRLRELVGDPLFVRQGSGMIATPRAETLVQALTPLMASLHSHLFDVPVFSPQTSVKTFRIGMSEWVEQWVMPKFLQQTYQDAPGVYFKVVNVDPYTARDAVEEGIVDVAISLDTISTQETESVQVRNMGYKTVWSQAQMSLSNPITLDEFLSKEHLLVSYRNASSSQLDQYLAQQGKSRRIRYVSPNFSSYPLLLNQQPFLATVPHGLAVIWQQNYNLTVSDVPVDYEDIKLCLLWHKRQTQDPALSWLLAHLQQAMNDGLGHP
ncbi:Nodulation protein D 2 [Vibrio ruber DSM 16370]|uniref:Nodulation protein D 2 n=1 Tax=Vibrio ruber (strain DSM 16370 / JCM 11486 / BCRC 17186 / CECT 7878 / LMG 23124 / VR1) TaxID=1123498 RepID=A0A1R4LD31_VIBR1|nr:LysR family transcriptional regulator [Vibrio ruber]SJN54319.1 Nodulation protein D 2 [Vibrio ruber DSM 16370]